MAVMLTTSLGEMVVDLYTDLCPVTCKNFLKLCKIKYYNNCLFHSVQKDFIAQTGDPTGTGSGGESVYSLLYGEQARFFDDEIRPKLKHDKIGVVAMASGGENLNASQFYITTRADIDYLDGKHTIFGEIAEGLETLMRINEAYVDEKGRPYKNIRIKHTYIVDDPFDDPPELASLIPERSPELKPPGEGEEVRLEDDWVPMDEKQDPEELEQSLRRKEAHSRAVVLEMIGDIPEAEVKPPENVLFVCKLNPVTQDEDLEIIFARFGKVVSADIIRDYKTGDSLCYAFIEFETQEACEAAYFKMDNTLIDDRRIHVDFSQSVSRLWSRFRRFGTKDTGENGGMNGNKKGCFNCGEPGHLARDCTNKPKAASDNAGPPEPKKYELKEEGGQRGNVGKRYDMLFEEQEHPEPEPAEKPARKDHSDRHPQKPHEDKPAPSRKHDGRHESRHSSREEGRARHRENDREEEQDNHSRRRPRHQTHRDDHLPHHHQRDRDRGVSDHSRERFDDRRDRDRDRDRGEDNRDSRDGRDRVPGGSRERKSWEERERRERERKEEARLDQEDREKEALEREMRDKKRKEKDSSGQEEEKQKEEAGGRRHDRSDSRDANRSKRRHREHRRDSGRRDD